jgi:hypothetical protein
VLTTVIGAVPAVCVKPEVRTPFESKVTSASTSTFAALTL